MQQNSFLLDIAADGPAQDTRTSAYCKIRALLFVTKSNTCEVSQNNMGVYIGRNKHCEISLTVVCTLHSQFVRALLPFPSLPVCQRRLLHRLAIDTIPSSSGMLFNSHLWGMTQSINQSKVRK